MQKSLTDIVPWTRSIASPFAFMAIGLVICTAVTIGFCQYWFIANGEEEWEAQRLVLTVHEAKRNLTEEIGDAQRKAIFLAKMPPIQGIIRAEAAGGIDPLDGSTLKHWRDRLAHIFASMIESAPNLGRIGYVQAANNNREIVSVRRLQGRIDRIPDDKLHEFGQQEDLSRAMKLSEGTSTLSDIHLSRDDSNADLPQTPHLRISTPIFSETGEVYGLIFVDMNMKPLLEAMHRSASPGEKLYLTNENGDYLLHPDRSKTFGFDLGSRHLLQVDQAVLKSFYSDASRLDASATIEDAQGENIIHAAKLYLDDADKARFLVAAAALPKNQLLAKSSETRSRIILISALLALAGAVFAMVFSRYMIQPLNELNVASQKLMAGISIKDIEVPSERSDEVGELSRSFRAMAGALETRNASLKEKEGKISAILEATVNPIITFDDKGDIQTINPATNRLFGYSKKELIGANISMLLSEEHRENYARYFTKNKESKDKDTGSAGQEVEGLKNDGTTFPIIFSVSEVPLKDKKLFTGIIIDLTEQKKVDRMKNEFVSTVSHELRTPLTAIKGSLGLVNSMMTQEFPNHLKSMLSIAYNNCDRLVRLVNDILDIEKMEAGKMTYAFQSIDLDIFLDNAVEANRSYAEELGVELQLEHMPDDVQVQADPDRLSQVVANLISNAAKFSPNGETVLVSAQKSEDLIRISVADRGQGIPEEFQEKIFGKFAQADSSDTKAQGGTGLGLAISKAIIEAHMGEIGFETSEGGGTTFFFDLPLVDAQSLPGDDTAAEPEKICA